MWGFLPTPTSPPRLRSERSGNNSCEPVWTTRSRGTAVPLFQFPIPQPYPISVQSAAFPINNGAPSPTWCPDNRPRRLLRVPAAALNPPTRGHRDNLEPHRRHSRVGAEIRSQNRRPTRTRGTHTAPLTHTVIPSAQRVVHTSYRFAEGCIMRKKDEVINSLLDEINSILLNPLPPSSSSSFSSCCPLRSFVAVVAVAILCWLSRGKTTKKTWAQQWWRQW